MERNGRVTVAHGVVAAAVAPCAQGAHASGISPRVEDGEVELELVEPSSVKLAECAGFTEPARFVDGVKYARIDPATGRGRERARPVPSLVPEDAAQARARSASSTSSRSRSSGFSIGARIAARVARVPSCAAAGQKQKGSGALTGGCVTLMTDAEARPGSDDS